MAIARPRTRTVSEILDRALQGERINDEDALDPAPRRDLVAVGHGGRRVAQPQGRPGRGHVHRRPEHQLHERLRHRLRLLRLLPPPGDRARATSCRSRVIFKKIEETLAIGGTGVLMQGGHHPDLEIEWYEDLFRSIKERYRVHLHALSPPEIQHIARRSKLPVPTVLTRLRDAGLDSLPGGGGEILVDRVRKIIAPKKTKTDEWLGVMRHAHRLGMSTTATMMYGHVETRRRARRALAPHPRPAGRAAAASAPSSPGRSSPTTRGSGEQITETPTSFDYLLTQAVSRHLPRQRRPHPVVVGHAGAEDRPGRAALRRRRPRLRDARGERRLGRRHHVPRQHRGLLPHDPRRRQASRAARHAVPSCPRRLLITWVCVRGGAEDLPCVGERRATLRGRARREQ